MLVTHPPICVKVNCVSYSDQDGCTYDNYDFEIHVDTGRIAIHHEILCGLMGTQLFCEPAIEKDFGIPIPDHVTQMIHMVLVNNAFQTEPRHKAAATDHFVKWLVDSMEKLAAEHQEHNELLQRLTGEKDTAEQEMEQQYQEHKAWVNTSIELLSLLQK